MRTLLAACLLSVGLTGASAEPARMEKGVAPSGPAKAAIETWFTAGREITCTDQVGVEGPCDLARVAAVRTFYDAVDVNAFAFVLYSPHIGNVVYQAVGQFRRAGDGWVLARNIRGVAGEGPDSLSFDNGRATFTMSVFMPGDDRCCLTGRQPHEVDLGTGAVSAGPAVPGAKTTAQDTPKAAPRPEGYKGATYFHNGSQVLVDERAGIIRYEEPKASIRKAVTKGTLLFRGSFRKDGSVEGTAYVFKAGCEPAPYQVSGRQKGSTITLKGSASRRDPNSCAILATMGGAHSTLTFEEYGDL